MEISTKKDLKFACPWNDWQDCYEERCPFYEKSNRYTVSGGSYEVKLCARAKEGRDGN